jgi:type IV secretory pathway VirB10-like protein
MENTNINILDQIDVNSSEMPTKVASSSNNVVSNSEGTNNNSENPLDFITKYFTKKNIYILCAVIIVAGLIYYFYLKKSSSKSNKSSNPEINIEVPPSNDTNNHYFIPLPDSTPKTMTQDEYNALVQQQLQQQVVGQPEQQQQQQQQQQVVGQQETISLPAEIKPQVIHPGQTLQNQNVIEDDNTEDIDLDLDNQKLTADEIKQISDQLQKLQAAESN